jgi:hypothetical protein
VSGAESASVEAMISPRAVAKPSFLACEIPGSFWVIIRQPASRHSLGVESVLLSIAIISKSLKVWFFKDSMQGRIYFSSLKVGTTTDIKGFEFIKAVFRIFLPQ